MNSFGIKNKQKILILTLLIALMATIVSLVGLCSSRDWGSTLITTIYGDVVKTYGIGLYFRDSVSVAAQGLAADLITLVIGVPLLITSVVHMIKGSFKAHLVLLGTIGYVLYTYTSYVFLWMYNPLFIMYVALMSMSLFALILLMMSVSVESIKDRFKETLPVRFIAIYQIVIGAMIGLLWLGKIAPTLTDGAAPEGIEHYTTLVIQGLDLGIVVPVAILSGMLLLKGRPMGYLLTSLVAVKGFTILLAISAMIVNQLMNGVEVSLVELVLFPVFNVFAIIVFIMFIRHVKSETDTSHSRLVNT
ncbi:MAG: hypothetical protein K9K93_04020 [Acholeplasmataceae bacterium]|nr:hypothetical protein [Acholeplasmataceae bacterium]